jgi:pimeloyl-[acyl-carrier protein] methyl ester esterase
VLPVLSQRYDVRVVSLPGYVGTNRIRSPSNALEDLADAVASEFAKLRPGNMPIILCGWSLGAIIALVAAARQPSRIRGLILVGANARFTISDDWQQALPHKQLDDFGAALERDPMALLKQFSRLIHRGDSAARQGNRAMASCLADGMPADFGTLQSGLETLRSADVRELMQNAKQPTLLLHGDLDPLMPLAGAQRLAKLLPNAKLEVFAGAAHAPFASQSAGFIERVDRFIRTLQ